MTRIRRLRSWGIVHFGSVENANCKKVGSNVETARKRDDWEGYWRSWRGESGLVVSGITGQYPAPHNLHLLIGATDDFVSSSHAAASDEHP